ncbi:hypothetical protein ACFPRL_29385 [Pseudoclavibacter helvolus]
MVPHCAHRGVHRHRLVRRQVLRRARQAERGQQCRDRRIRRLAASCHRPRHADLVRLLRPDRWTPHRDGRRIQPAARF